MAFTLRRRGKNWYARGTAPFRQADGSIKNVKIEESTGEANRAKAQKVAADKWAYHHEQAYRPTKAVATFQEAAEVYIETKDSSERDRDFIDRIVGQIGDMQLDEIDQAVLAKLCKALYPEGAAAATLHRAVYAPVTYVLRLAGFNVRFEKPKIQRSEVEVPDDDWFRAILPHCRPGLRGLVLFLTLTGRRVTESLNAIYNKDGTATIAKDKRGKPIRVKVPEIVKDLVDPKPGYPMFTGDRHSVNQSLQVAAKNAGVKHYPTHALGRHSFATRLLNEGYSAKFVAEAGGWESTRMVDLIYGHLEQGAVQDEMLKVGEAWEKKL